MMFKSGKDAKEKTKQIAFAAVGVLAIALVLSGFGSADLAFAAKGGASEDHAQNDNANGGNGNDSGNQGNGGSNGSDNNNGNDDNISEIPADDQPSEEDGTGSEDTSDGTEDGSNSEDQTPVEEQPEDEQTTGDGSDDTPVEEEQQQETDSSDTESGQQDGPNEEQTENNNTDDSQNSSGTQGSTEETSEEEASDEDESGDGVSTIRHSGGGNENISPEMMAGWCDAECMANLIQKAQDNFMDEEGNVEVISIDEIQPFLEMDRDGNAFWYWFYVSAFEQATGESFASLSGYQQATVLMVLGYNQA